MPKPTARPTATKQIDPAVAAILQQLHTETDQPAATPAKDEPHPFSNATPPSAFTIAAQQNAFAAAVLPTAFTDADAFTGATPPSAFTTALASEAPSAWSQQAPAPSAFTLNPGAQQQAAAPGGANAFLRRPRSGKKITRVIRRVVIVPPFGQVARRVARWVLPAEELHNAYEECNGDHLWEPGDGVDFDDAAICAAAASGCPDDDHRDDADHGAEAAGEHRHPLVASLVRAGANPMSLVDLEQYFCDEQTADALWTTRLRPQLLVVRAAALADPRRLLTDAGLLAGLIARRALAMGGYEFPPGLYSGEYLIELLLGHLDEPGIRAALADLIALEHPDLVGDQGRELGRIYAAMRDREIYLHHPDCLQFFTFDRLHAAPPAATKYVELGGRYLATMAVYRSALDEPDAGWPSMVIGWRKVTLVGIGSTARWQRSASRT